MIKTENLARTYSRGSETVSAVRGLSMQVGAGEVVGFFGPNGAGKTTTMRMLTTLLRPTSGRARIAGCDLLDDPGGVRARIGYVPQGTGLYPENTVFENLVLQGRLHRMPKKAALASAEDLVERLELNGFRDQLARTLSGGQRRRTDIALALIHRPQVLFLDEPTTGLDPQSRAHLWDHIRTLHGETTVFFTTHYIEEADGLADRVLVIDHGEIIARGTPDHLKSAMSGGDLIRLSVPVHRVGEAKLVAQRLPWAEGVRATDDGTVSFSALNGEMVMGELLRTLNDAGITVLSLQLTRPSLAEVFLSLTGRSLRDDAA